MQAARAWPPNWSTRLRFPAQKSTHRRDESSSRRFCFQGAVSGQKSLAPSRVKPGRGRSRWPRVLASAPAIQRLTTESAEGTESGAGTIRHIRGENCVSGIPLRPGGRDGKRWGGWPGRAVGGDPPGGAPTWRARLWRRPWGGAGRGGRCRGRGAGRRRRPGSTRDPRSRARRGGWRRRRFRGG